MAEISVPGQDCVAAQRELFRLAEKDHSLSIAVLAKRNSHLKTSTMKAWRNGAAMPVYALGELKIAGVPDYLLSLLFEPFAAAFVSDPEDGDGDLDTAAEHALDFARAVQIAHHRDSPGGLTIVPQEKALIEPIRQRACASLRRAAA